MSTAFLPTPVSSAVHPPLWTVEPYEYPVFDGPVEDAAAEPEWIAWQPGEEDHALAAEPEPESAAEEPAHEPATVFDEELLAEAREQGYEAGLRQGREEGRIAAREEARAELAEHDRAAALERQSEFSRLAESFHEARERYFHQVEPEVVRLALAVAARILRREAQMDPLLLTGAVRVALGQIAASSKVRLKVPPPDLDLWTEAIAHLPKLAVRPEVVAGENMRLGDCLIETELGSVDLGIRSQLSEIERGFFDRPGFRAETATDSPASETPAASEPRA